MTAEGSDANALIFEFLLPRAGLCLVLNQLVECAMRIIWIAARANFHGLKPESTDLIEHFIERKVIVNGIENANGNFLFCASCNGNAGCSSDIQCSRRFRQRSPCCSAGDG